MLTPVLVGLPSLLIKTTSSLNPLCFAFAHPVYREELAKYVPCLGIGNMFLFYSLEYDSIYSSINMQKNLLSKIL